MPPGGDVTESDSMVSITRREETDDVFDDTESSITSVSQAAAGKLVRKGLRMAPLCRPACHCLRLFHFWPSYFRFGFRETQDGAEDENDR